MNLFRSQVESIVLLSEIGFLSYRRLAYSPAHAYRASQVQSQMFAPSRERSTTVRSNKAVEHDDGEVRNEDSFQRQEIPNNGQS